MISFSELASRVYSWLPAGWGLTRAKVATILDRFVGILIEDLQDNGEVNVPGLGTFKAKIWSQKRISVTFKPHPTTIRALRQALGGKLLMEKYGVEQEKAGDKTAGPGGKCPECGSTLEKDAAMRKCPKCGTKPFEKREEPKDGGSQAKD